MKECPSCKAMRSDKHFVSKNGQREVGTCSVCRETQDRYRIKNQVWDQAQFNELKCIAPGMTCEQLAAHFDRTKSSVRNKLFRHRIEHLKLNGEVNFGSGSPVINNKNSIENLISQSWVCS